MNELLLELGLCLVGGYLIGSFVADYVPLPRGWYGLVLAGLIGLAYGSLVNYLFMAFGG